MAKSGDITVTGATPFVAAVQGDVTPEMSLGQASAALLQGSDEELVLLINGTDRTIRAYLESAVGGAVQGANDPYLLFTPQSVAKVATWTVDDPTGAATIAIPSLVSEDSMVGVIMAKFKPAFSMASLISKIEDEFAKANQPAPKIVVNQATGKIYVWTTADPPPTPANPVATVTQTIPDNTGVIKNAFE
jgi:hypothetical protein